MEYIKKALNPIESNHQKEFRFFGLRKSGNHAIINWVVSHLLDQGEKVCFLNDINHANLWKPRGDDLPAFKGKPRPTWKDDIDTLVVSAEDDWASRDLAVWDSGLQNYTTIEIFRDIRDVAASRIARVGNVKASGKGGWGFDLMDKGSNGRFNLLNFSDSYEGADFSIDYGLWNDHREYRDVVGRRLGFENCDLGKGQEPRYGFGSSFGKPPSPGESRWMRQKDHPVMKEFLSQLFEDFL